MIVGATAMTDEMKVTVGGTVTVLATSAKNTDPEMTETVAIEGTMIDGMIEGVRIAEEISVAHHLPEVESAVHQADLVDLEICE